MTTHCENCEARLTVNTWNPVSRLCDECEAAEWDEVAEDHQEFDRINHGPFEHPVSE